jgi:hypothetical protein
MDQMGKIEVYENCRKFSKFGVQCKLTSLYWNWFDSLYFKMSYYHYANDVHPTISQWVKYILYSFVDNQLVWQKYHKLTINILQMKTMV